MRYKPAIILETKSEAEGVSKEKHVKELFKNIDVVAKKYSKTIGILYSGSAIRVFRNKIELSDASKHLENKDYYIRLCTSQKLDNNYIFEITQKINNSLHFKFGMTDLQDRMIFTACALVAQRYNPQNGLQKLKDMDYSTFHNWIYSALSKALEDDKKQNSKLDVLLEEYASVRMSITENQEAINDFIDNVCQIADLVNSDNWNGEDVMAIFFNEFNRYRGKAQAGQVFTPDHIASFMYRLIDVNMNDRVLDATCGSGTFLVKSMCNMIREAGGSNTSKAKQIKSEQLFGIDLDKEKILWTDRKRHTIFSLPLSFTKYTLTETKLIIQRGCFNLREDEIQLYRVRDIAFKQNFYERLCRVGSIHLCSTDAMTPDIDIRRIKNPRDVKEVLSKTIEACRKANGIRTSEIIGDHGHFPEPAPHGMPPEPCHEHPHN